MEALSGTERKRRGYQSKMLFVKDGKMVAYENEILDKWVEHVDQLLNSHDFPIEGQPQEREQTNPNEEEAPDNVNEIKNILRDIKGGKSPGEDELTIIEMFKYEVKYLVEHTVSGF